MANLRVAPKPRLWHQLRPGRRGSAHRRSGTARFSASLLVASTGGRPKGSSAVVRGPGYTRGYRASGMLLTKVLASATLGILHKALALFRQGQRPQRPPCDTPRHVAANFCLWVGSPCPPSHGPCPHRARRPGAILALPFPLRLRHRQLRTCPVGTAPSCRWPPHAATGSPTRGPSPPSVACSRG